MPQGSSVPHQPGGSNTAASAGLIPAAAGDGHFPAEAEVFHGQPCVHLQQGSSPGAQVILSYPPSARLWSRGAGPGGRGGSPELFLSLSVVILRLRKNLNT